MALGAAHATRRTRLGVSACRCGLVRRRRRSSAVPLILCGTMEETASLRRRSHHCESTLKTSSPLQANYPPCPVS